MTQAKPRWTYPVAVLAIVFGLMTLKEGGAVLFFDGAERRAAGHYVPFVLWFNFVAGFAYVAVGAGIATGRRWAGPLASAVAGLTVLVFAAFGLHVATGGEYETRTVIAMTLRSSIWLGAAWITGRGHAEAVAPDRARTGSSVVPDVDELPTKRTP